MIMMVEVGGVGKGQEEGGDERGRWRG